jgi:Leucine-rich repeat (LRR) protein
MIKEDYLNILALQFAERAGRNSKAMSGIESISITLSTIIVKSAIKIWLRDSQVASDASADAVDALSIRASSLLDQRKLRRTFDEMTDVVTRRLTTFVKAEFQGMPENERIAAILAVSDTFNRAGYADDYLFANDLNAGYIHRHLKRRSVEIGATALLSESAASFYNVLLGECCEYVVQITLTLPQFQTSALTEILRRSTDITTGLAKILERLPDSLGKAGSDAFSVNYRRQVINQLDNMELFGATLDEASRRYPLSVAYISLNMNRNGEEAETTESIADNSDGSGAELTVEQGLAVGKRIFIRGPAGSGKSTLLKWIAVRSALRDLHGPLNDWNSSIPFFLPLRRFADTALPTPNQFADTVGRFMSEEMPPGYASQILRAGQATVLVDGLDEFPERRREEIRNWLNELIAAYPNSKYVVTSRPGAVADKWLLREQFIEFELLPMTLSDIREFIRNWHDAARVNASDKSTLDKLSEFEESLGIQIAAKRHLRALAQTPLLCALLCALYSDRRGQLPNSRMELYDVALEMLLERRDAEHQVVSDMALSRAEKTILLQDIAYWLIRNGWSDAPRSMVVNRIDLKLRSMSQVNATGHQVYQHLLERSGLIREPAAERVDFVHRTFQEYLAALDILAAGDIGLLVDRADLDDWREVVIMAVGHAYTREREEILAGLIRRGDSCESHRDQLYLLAVASLETSPELSADLRDAVRERAALLLPPQSLTAAKSLAAAGDFVVGLLAEAAPRRAAEVASTIRAAAEIGSDAALQVIRKFSNDNRETVNRELVHAWRYFDPEEYAKVVLSQAQRAVRHLHVRRPELVVGLRYLPSIMNLTIRYLGKIDLSFVRYLTKLQYLDVDCDEVNNLAAICSARNIRRLGIKASNVSDLTTLRGLPELRSLFLSGPAVRDISAVAQWADLEELSLAETRVEDLSPIASCLALRDLSMWGSNVENLTPISGLRQLNNLSIMAGRISDVSPLASLSGLRRLELSWNELADLSPLSNLTELTYLAINHTNVQDLSPIASLTDLKHLEASNTQISDLRPLAALTELRRLDVSSSNVSSLEAIRTSGKLESIDIGDTKITDLAPLASAAKIHTLTASRTGVQDIGPLANLKELRFLFLRSTAVSDLGPLRKVRSLERLDISNTRVRSLEPLSGCEIKYLAISEALQKEALARKMFTGKLELF